jgi:hypothetical protein
VVVLPPGYADPANASKRYPVAYVGHGYGMTPDGLSMVGVVAGIGMLDPKATLQKFILVIVDGACRPGGDIASGGPLPLTGDLCEEGTFYTDHADGAAKAEAQLIELESLVEQTYRVKAAEDRLVQQ